uniref:Uncharacterized protein n=1 Tax=Panagrolaimus sp. JU765 TaxID=591449 RepID=A0AC34QXE9_9BILA
MKVIFVGIILVSVGFAAPQFGGPPPQPNAMGGFPPMPPQLKQILPADTVAKLEAIHNDNSLGFKEKHEKIDKIMSSLPTDILDKIPPPPGFERLPEDVQQ